MKKQIALCLLLLAFISCYKQTVTINDNLTGRYNLSLVMSKDCLSFFDSINNTKTSVDTDLFFLNDEAALRAQLQQNNITIRQIAFNEDARNKSYSIDLAFNSIDQLPATLLTKYFKNTVTSDKTSITIHTVIDPGIIGTSSTLKGIYNSLDEQMKTMVDAYASMITFTFAYNSKGEPLKSQSSKKGTFTNNNSVEYTFSLAEILQAKNNIEITTVFKK